MAARSASMASTASAAAGSTARAPPRAAGSTTGPSSSRCRPWATTTPRSCPSSSTARRSAVAWKPWAASRSSFRAKRRNEGGAVLRPVTNRQYPRHEFRAADPDRHDLRRFARAAFGALLRRQLLSQFAYAVQHVVPLRAEEQVIGIDARAHVAAMAHQQAL